MRKLVRAYHRLTEYLHIVFRGSEAENAAWLESLREKQRTQDAADPLAAWRRQDEQAQALRAVLLARVAQQQKKIRQLEAKIERAEAQGNTGRAKRLQRILDFQIEWLDDWQDPITGRLRTKEEIHSRQVAKRKALLDELERLNRIQMSHLHTPYYGFGDQREEGKSLDALLNKLIVVCVFFLVLIILLALHR